jgi:hypothetical protein
VCTAARADAAALTLHAGDMLDGPAFHLLVPNAPHVTIRAAVATDIDSDGDLDVVATTDRGLVVWVNDGAGHFRRRHARPHPIMTGPAVPDTWSDDSARCAETVQTRTVFLPLIVVRAHAPPLESLPLRGRDRRRARAETTVGSCPPRAPPFSHA